MTRFQASLLALAGGASYGLLSGFTKMAYSSGVQTGPLTTMQNLVGTIILWLLVYLVKPDWQQVTRQQVVRLILVGILPGLTGAFYYLALSYLPAAIGIILLFQFTWMGVLLDFILEGKRPDRYKLVAIACLIPGTLLAVGVGQAEYSLSWPGVVFGLLSAITYTGFIYCTGRVAPEVSPWLRSPLIVTGSFLINLVVFPPTYFPEAITNGPLLLWGSLMGIFGPVIPTICFTFGVPLIGGGLAALLGAVELPVVVSVAFFVLKEQITWLQWMGVAIILLGVYFSEGNAKDCSETSTNYS